ncbi:MAG: hypothetical protein IPN79_06075 [Saprospiraceae bacterium]|nr:hypothetical protein [Saprospiraceae bacterium]
MDERKTKGRSNPFGLGQSGRIKKHSSPKEDYIEYLKTSGLENRSFDKDGQLWINLTGLQN